MGFEVLEDAGHIGGNHESSFGVDEPSAVQRVLEWVDGLPPGAPFLAVYLPVAGHHPYETPEKGPFPDKELIGMYRNALHYGDAAIAQLLHGLGVRGRYDETILVLAGDHGEAFGEHQGNFGHTFFVYEENVHVPCLIVAPGLIERGQRVRRVASLLDLAPTVLDLLGLQPPAVWEGRTLLEPAPRMALCFTDYSLGLLGLRDGPWKLIHKLDAGRTALFDLVRDPGELSSVATEHAERVAAYREILLGWSAERRAEMER
jgi:arylsulfatase A-like enzyme